MFTDLTFDKFCGFPNHIEDFSLENNVFYYVHFCADPGFCPFVADKTYTRALEETLWVLAEEKDCGAADFFLPISCYNEVFVTAEILQWAFSITNLSGVFSDKIQINVIHSGITDRDVFKVTSSLCVHQSGALLKIHFLGFIAYTIEHLIRLVCMELRTWIYMHEKDVVWIPFFIHTVYDAGVHTDRGNAIIKWSTKQFIDVGFLTVNAGNSTFVFQPDCNIAAISVCKCDNGDCQGFCIEPGAFSVKYLNSVVKRICSKSFVSSIPFTSNLRAQCGYESLTLFYILTAERENIKLVKKKFLLFADSYFGRIVAEADGVKLNPESYVSMNFWGFPVEGGCTPAYFDVLEQGFKEFFENDMKMNPL